METKVSLRKSTNSRLINVRYITTDMDKCREWLKSRRNCAHLDEDVFNEKSYTYGKQMLMYTAVLGQVSDGNVAYKKYGIPNRTNVFNRIISG